ncbi:MAG: tyrosinase cofactor [Nitrospira sp.]|nr:tyrosinase cofactor [Nitrospira sp.]MDR4467716.1 tyrosinase cofactor [Nitrospira sp.]
MATNHKEVLEGCTIEIRDDDHLTINGKEIHYEHNRSDGTWSSKYLPYTKYPSLLAMARAIVRDTVEFSHVKE